MSTFRINLHQMLYALSDCLDLVGVTHIHHGKRVAYMAAECGKLLDWKGSRLDSLFQAAILHDCGVSNTSVHSQLTHLEWENELNHCHVGYELLMQTRLLERLAEVIKYHHTHWSVLKDLDLPMEIKLSANCIYMADRVDILTLGALKDQSNILLGKNATRIQIQERKGDWFCPELVDAFMEISASEAFWFNLEAESVNGYAASWVSHDHVREMLFDELRDLLHVFSVIVDAKSSFTREHSDGVARVARYIGQLFRLPERTCDMLEFAGLLHDIGKLRVPDELLDKQGKFEPGEYELVQRHSFDTFNILKKIRGFDDVALWASQHHERMDGSGYPYHLTQQSLSLEARIVAVADVFHALAQSRPYRESLPPNEIMRILKENADGEKLDKEIVSRVEANLQSCWIVALASVQRNWSNHTRTQALSGK